MDRRSFLHTMGAAGALGFAESVTPGSAGAQGHIVHEAADGPTVDARTPEHSIRFAVCGMSHDHIYGMVNAIVRGGGVLVAVYGAEPDKAAAFHKRYPDAKMVSSEREIIDDPSIQLVLSSTIPNQRAALGVEVMRHGKDFLSDKPGMTTLEQLADVRKTIAETKRIYAIGVPDLLCRWMS